MGKVTKKTARAVAWTVGHVEIVCLLIPLWLYLGSLRQNFDVWPKCRQSLHCRAGRTLDSTFKITLKIGKLIGVLEVKNFNSIIGVGVRLHSLSIEIRLNDITDILHFKLSQKSFSGIMTSNLIIHYEQIKVDEMVTGKQCSEKREDTRHSLSWWIVSNVILTLLWSFGLILLVPIKLLQNNFKHFNLCQLLNNELILFDSIIIIGRTE